MRSRGQREGVVLVLALRYQSDTHPHAGLVLESRRSLELYHSDVRRQVLRFEDTQLRLFPAQRDEFVEHEKHGWADQIDEEHGFLYDDASAVEDGQDVEDDEEFVRQPK